MGIAVNALQGARETVDKLTPSPEAIKAAASNTIQNAYASIRGSGSIMTELGKTKDAFLGMPAEAIGGALKASGQLLTLQPINATRTVATGLINTCKNLAKFTTSPIPVALAAAENSYKTTKSVASTVVRFPKTAVLKGYGVVERGVNEVLDIFGSSTEAAPKAADLGGSVPPPAAPKAV